MHNLTTLKEGQVFHGYQQYFEVLSVEDDRVTIYEDAGDYHRIEEGSMADICKMLNAALDFDPTGEYFTTEHPEITTLELFPGDWEYEEDNNMKFEELHRDVTLQSRYDKMKTYRSINEGGRILEAWDRDENGEWHDVTLREQEIQKAEWDLAKAQRELRKAQEVKQ